MFFNFVKFCCIYFFNYLFFVFIINNNRKTLTDLFLEKKVLKATKNIKVYKFKNKKNMKMSVYLFTALCYLLLFVLMCNTLCGQTLVSAQGPQVTEKNPFELFNEKSITTAQQTNGKPKAGEVNVKNYYSPVLVSVNNVFFAFAGVERADASGKRYIDILTKYVQNKDELTAKDWTPQFAVQHQVTSSDPNYFVKGLLAVAAEEKVYLLLLNYTKQTDSKWEFKFAVATINNEEESSATQIVWSEEAIESDKVIKELKTQFAEEPDTSFSFSGSAFVTEEKKIVFALVVENLEKKVLALMQLDGKTKIVFETGLVYTDVLKKCYPYIFTWESKIIIIVGNCEADNGEKIMEVTNVGQPWEKSTGAFSRQLEFLKNKKHFMKAKIAEESVLLFTEERAKTGEKQDKDVNLWMSDGNRYINLGPITTIKSTETFTASILPTDNGLFALYQKCKIEETIPGTIDKICFINLKQHFTKITDTVKAWKQINDDEIKKLYKNTDKENNLFSADGLVGFLSGTDGKDKWIDKCRNVDAIIHKEGAKTQTANGFKFTGQGAGAQWLVGEQKDNQPYNLKYSGFTLVATVTIGSGTKANSNSILGVVLGDKPLKSVGLWCTTGGKWGINSGDGQPETQPSAVNCTPNKTYYIAVILDNTNKKILFYVNGQKLKEEGIDIASENVKHFYFGVDQDKTKNTDVTIADVLLYNLLIDEEKINKLIPKETIVADDKQTTEIKTNQQTPIENKTETHTPQDISPTEKEEMQSSSPPPTTEDSSVRLSVVGVLCFMLFGVFTLLGRYVY